MSTITGKLNLAVLEGTAIIQGKLAQPLLVIDINKANLFKSEKGAIYLDIIAFENANKQYSDYSIKQSLPKEITEREKAEDKQRPFLGNMSYMIPKEITAPTMSFNEAGIEQSSDLPF